MPTVDTLKAFNILKAADLTEAQAHAIVDVIKTVQDTWIEKLATKEDLKELEYRFTIRLGAMLAAAVAILAALVKLL